MCYGSYIDTDNMWHVVMGSVTVLDSVLRVGIRNGCRGRKI